jgi:hypothetical protein
MHISLRYIFIPMLLALACAALSGMLVSITPAALLLAHLLSSMSIVPLAVAFLRRHWWLRRSKIAHHSNTIFGFIALTCLLLLLLSGLALLWWTSVPALHWLHRGATVILLLDLSLHMAWRLRRCAVLNLSACMRRPTQRQRPRAVLHHTKPRYTVMAIGALGIVLTGVLWPSSPRFQAQAEETMPLSHNSLQPHAVVSATNCVSCHSDIAKQWQRSAHANAATDTYYQALASVFIQERGRIAVRYCATCHNPVGLMQGEIGPSAAQQGNLQGSHAYADRALGITLRMSPLAAEGVTCSMCHQATVLAEQPTNGSIQLAAAPTLPADLLSRLSLRAYPEEHRAAMLRPVIARAELCGGCHNLHLPDGGMALEPTFDEWLQSPYPARGQTCQSCHMASVTGRSVDSGLPQEISDHGLTPGAPSSLPALGNDLSLLRQAATLDVAIEQDEAGLRATVTITNSGAGHYLPTGADDLRQIWLEAKLYGMTGELLWQSGALDAYGTLALDTVQFRKVLGDANGQPIDLHRFWMATQILRDTRLAPLEARRIDYHIGSVPDVQPFRLTIRLLYRDVPQAFAEFALNRSITDLPVYEMARGEARLP